MSGVLIPPPVFVDSNNVEELGRFIRVGILVEHYPYWSSGWVYGLQVEKGLFDNLDCKDFKVEAPGTCK